MPQSNEPVKVPLISIAQQWEIFAKHIFDFKPSTIQHDETRNAFFCGFTAAFHLLTEGSSSLSGERDDGLPHRTEE